jgi:hypothetical protein
MTTPSMLPHLTALTVGIQLTRSGHTSEKNSHVLSNGSINTVPTISLSFFFLCGCKVCVSPNGQVYPNQRLVNFYYWMISRISLIFSSIFNQFCMFGFFFLVGPFFLMPILKFHRNLRGSRKCVGLIVPLLRLTACCFIFHKMRAYT